MSGYYNGDNCAFCNEKAQERFFSGSYQSYKTCDCEGRKIYDKAQEDLRMSKVVAERNTRIFELNKELRIAESNIKRIKNALSYLDSWN